jgi:hypothetical protein
VIRNVFGALLPGTNGMLDRRTGQQRSCSSLQRVGKKRSPARLIQNYSVAGQLSVGTFSRHGLFFSGLNLNLILNSSLPSFAESLEAFSACSIGSANARAASDAISSLSFKRL